MPFTPDEIAEADQHEAVAAANETADINLEVQRRYKQALAAGAPIVDRQALVAGIADAVRRERGVTPTFGGEADVVDQDTSGQTYRTLTSPIVGAVDASLGTAQLAQDLGERLPAAQLAHAVGGTLGIDTAVPRPFETARQGLQQVVEQTRPEDQGFVGRATETIGQSIGQTVLPAGMNAARRLALTSAAAGAGAAAPQVEPNYQQAIDRGLTPAEAALYAGGQLATESLFTAVGGKVARGLGLDEGAEALAGVRGAAQVPLTALPTAARRLGGVAVEGGLEEPGTEAAQILQDRLAGIDNGDENQRLLMASVAGTGGAGIAAVKEGFSPTRTMEDDFVQALAEGQPVATPLLEPAPAVAPSPVDLVPNTAASANTLIEGANDITRLGDQEALVQDAGRTQVALANEKGFQAQQARRPDISPAADEMAAAEDIVRQREAQGLEALGNEPAIRAERDAALARQEQARAATGGSYLDPRDAQAHAELLAERARDRDAFAELQLAHEAQLADAQSKLDEIERRRSALLGQRMPAAPKARMLAALDAEAAPHRAVLTQPAPVPPPDLSEPLPAAPAPIPGGRKLPAKIEAARARREQIAGAQAASADQALKDAALAEQQGRAQIEGEQTLAAIEARKRIADARTAAIIEAQRSTPEAMAEDVFSQPNPAARIKRMNDLGLSGAARANVARLVAERQRGGTPANAQPAVSPAPATRAVPPSSGVVAKPAGLPSAAPGRSSPPAAAQPPAPASAEATVAHAERRTRLKQALAGTEFKGTKTEDVGESGVRWVLPSGKTVDFHIVPDLGKINETSWIDSVTEGGRNKQAIKSVVAAASAAEVAAGRPAIRPVENAAEFRKLLPADKAKVLAFAPAIAATTDISGKSVGFGPQTLIRLVEGRGETTDAIDEERNHAAVGALLPPSDIRILQREDPQLGKLQPTSAAFLEAAYGKYKSWRDARDERARTAVSPGIRGVWMRLKNSAKALFDRLSKASPGAMARTSNEVFEDVYTGNVGQKTGEPNRMTGSDENVDAPGYATRLDAPKTGDLTRDALMKQWRKAHGDRKPDTASAEWQELVAKAREVDAAQGKPTYATPKTGAAAFTQGTREQLEPTERESTTQWEADAAAMRKADPKLAEGIADKVISGTLLPAKDGRIALNDREQTALAQELEDQFTKTEANFTEANAMRLAKLAYADDVAGTAWGRAGVARQRGMIKSEDGRRRMMLRPVFAMSDYTRRELAKAEETGNKARIKQLEASHFAKVSRVIDRMKKSTGIDLLDPRLGAVFSDAYAVANVMRLADASTAISDRHYNVGDWVRAFWRQGLLSFPATAVVNVSSNFVNAGLRAAVRQTASLGKGDLDVLASYYAGFLKGLPTAAKNAMASFIAGEDVLTTAEKAKSGLAAETKGPRVPLLFGLAVRPMAAGDSFIKTLAAYSTVGAEAYRLAPGNREQKAVAMANAMRDPASNPDAWAAAMVEARKTTFQDLFDKDQGGSQSDLTNVVRGLNLMVNGEPTGLASLVLPFVSTPTAITRQGTDYIPPLKAVRMLRKYYRGGYAGENNQELSQDLAQLAIGSLLTAAVMGLAGDEDDPLITGTQSDDASEFAGEYEGRRPPSYSMKLMGKWYSYRDLGPIGTALASMTDIARAVHNGDHVGAESYSKALRGLASGTILDSLLPVVGMLGDVVSKGDVTNGLENYAARTVGNFIVPAIIRGSIKASQATGEKRRSIDKLPNAEEAAAGEKSPTFGRRIRQAAGLEQAAEVLTVWGENAPGQRIDSTGDLAMRFFRALPLGYKPNEYDLAIEKYNATQPDKSQKLALAGWDPTVRIDGKDRTMTGEEYSAHVRLAGGYFKQLADGAGINTESPTALDMKKLGDARKQASTLAREETKKKLTNDPTLELQARLNKWKIANPNADHTGLRFAKYMTAAEGGTKDHPKLKAVAENYRAILDTQLKAAGF